MSTVKVYPDAGQLAEAAARHIVTLAKAAIADRERFTIALSGGSTPQPTYERLAQSNLADQINWAAVHVFWGDERCVPPDDPDSNYLMACEAWLGHVPIPPDNIHRIKGEMAPAAAAAEYEGMLRAFFAPSAQEGQPFAARFDSIFLGMGEDGHTASLFPGAEALHEAKRWVTAYKVKKLNAWRVTLTPVVFNAAAQVTFLVSGARKAERLQQVLYGPYKPDKLPAQIIRPQQGSLLWMVDAAAAKR
jgi:6-phosphogluconolactonase